jgi:hypothetical protein
MMTLEELKAKIEEYDAKEADIRRRLEVATTDRQRWELERMLRLTQITGMGFVNWAEREVSQKWTKDDWDERTGNADRETLHP